MPTIRKSRNPDAPACGRPEDTTDNLVLPGRAHNAIRNTLGWDRGRDVTIAEMDATPDATLMRTPNFGLKSLREVRAEIDRYLGRQPKPKGGMVE